MAIDCGQVKNTAVALKKPGVIRLAQMRRRLDQSVKHRLQIEGRAADDLEHVGGGGLLLQRFGEIACARLQLVEQPCVLNRYYGLIGECRQERDLARCERSNLGARNGDRADGTALTQHRYSERASIGYFSSKTGNAIGGIGQYIRDFRDGAMQDGAP